MNLTPRDKKLLVALGIVIFLVVFLKFLLLPKIDNITTLKTDIDALKNTYTMNMTFKAKTESLDSDIKILSKKLEDLRAIYPPSINADELLIIMKQLIRGSQLNVTSMTFERAKPLNLQADVKATSSTNAQGESQTSVPAGDEVNQLQEQQQLGINTALLNGTAANILDYFYLWGLKSQQALDGTEAIVIPDGKGYCVSVKIDAQGTNDQIKSFLNNLSNLENKAYCKNSSIVGLSNGGNASKQNLKFSAEIEFYGIMDKGAGEYYLLPDGKWMPIAAAGKSDVFKSYSGYTATASNNNESTFGIIEGQKESNSKSTELGNYDFSLVAAAFGGGLAPSVSVVCKNPEAKAIYSNPVVYGDNKGIENAEIFIEEKAGKYYCKLKTDHEVYPDKEYNQTFEFVPVGKDLRLVILSSRRNSIDDKAGVNLSIINNTNKNLTYTVMYEDEKTPRVKVGKTVGSVNNEK